MSSSETQVSNMTDNGTFLYFSYGSNLNSKRIHVNNPSAKRIGAGLLKNYRLDFNRFSERWKGAVATVVPDENENVWGAVWEIDAKDMENLDKQEGVERQIYHVFHPTIHINKREPSSNDTLASMPDSNSTNPPSLASMPDSNTFNPPSLASMPDSNTFNPPSLASMPDADTIPSMTNTLVCRCYHLSPEQMTAADVRPSITYLNIIIDGAVESGLPQEYVRKLQSVEHNGEEVEFTNRKVYL